MKLVGQFKSQIKCNLLRKPLFIFRAFNHSFRNCFFEKTNCLRTMVIMINYDCNCTCNHCFIRSFAHDQRGLEPLSINEMRSAISEMIDNGVFHFVLQGGEPFLSPHLDEIIKACKPHKSYVTVVTNGTVADRERLRDIYRAGVDKIAVSLDSYFSSEHDLFRGLKGCHEKSLKTIDIARMIGLDVAIAVTVTNDNLYNDSIEKLFEWAIKNKMDVEINIPQPIGNWDGREDLILTDDNFRYINELHLKYPNIRRDLYPHLGRSGCPAVKESMYMSMYGDICPCVYMHISLGNIRNHFLRDIRKNALSVREFGDYIPRCLASEDRDFVKKYVGKGFGEPKPVNGFKIFDLKEPLNRTRLL